MAASFLDLDVRPTLRAGREPFGDIMAALNALQPGQGLRLIAPFQPVPLFGVMESRGFSHEARELETGDWEVLFRPGEEVTGDQDLRQEAIEPDAWPAASRDLDVRDLDPPEPMVRILSTIEAMSASEVLSARLAREPVFLFPELEKRGHEWRGCLETDGSSYKLLVRVAMSRRAVA